VTDDKMKTTVDINERINEAIENIRPYLQADGGDVRVVGINKDNYLEIELLGACKTCAMAAMTMKAGVEEVIRRAAPKIAGVVTINVPQEHLTG